MSLSFERALEAHLAELDHALEEFRAMVADPEHLNNKSNNFLAAKGRVLQAADATFLLKNARYDAERVLEKQGVIL